MANQIEIRLGGTGGQGLITSGIILAQAAIMSGKNAIQSQSYGPEARGGASKAEVIISDEEIYYPKVSQADVLLVMSEEAYKKYKNSLKKGGILIIDSSLITEEPNIEAKVYKVPITKKTEEKFGKTLGANIVGLGSLVAVTGVVSKEILEKAVYARFPRAKELNKAAIDLGFELIKKSE